MVEINKYIWMFPGIGGVTALIALLTPAVFFVYRSASLDSDFLLWIFSLFYSHRYESGIHTISIEFDTHLISLVPSILCSLIIIILSIITIITAIKYKKGVLENRVGWLVSAIGTIIATVIWMVMMEISRRVLYGHEFWGILMPNFGIIGPFLGAGLEIIGHILLKKRQRNE